MLRAEGISRLEARGLAPEDAAVVVDHLEQADAAGKHGHGLGRIPWIEGLLGSELDPRGRPERVEREAGFERWHGRGALGYLTLHAVTEALVAEPPERARLVVCEACFPTGVLGAWARRLAEAGLVSVVTATSPRRLPHPEGGVPLTGTNPIAIAVPSYLGFRDRAANNAAKANLRAALPAAEAYFGDATTDTPAGGGGSYAGMDAADLAARDSGISSTLSVASAGATSYCLTDTVSGKTWSVLGPGPSSTDYKNNATCA